MTSSTAWRVVADDYSSPYIGKVAMPHYQPPIPHLVTAPGASVEHDDSAPHPHPKTLRGIWAWRAEHIDAALRMRANIAGGRLLEIEYDDPDDVVVPRRQEIEGVAIVLRRCRVVRELDELDALLALASVHATHPDSRIHGVDHWRRVAEIGTQLAAETAGADRLVVLIFGAIHDSQRQNDGHDPEHGQRAATLARRLGFGLAPRDLTTLCDALADHDRGLVTDDPTIGCCWDADRLDLRRLDRRVDPNLLSTEAGRRAA